MYDLVEFVRKNPPPELIKYYDPTKDQCPHCKTNRKSGTNYAGPRGYQIRQADPNIEIKFRTIAGKKTVFLGKKICTYECLKKELSDMSDNDYSLWMSIVKQFALEEKLEHGTAFKFDEGYRNQGLKFWDDKKKEVVPADGDLNGGYGGVPINFPVGDGDFNPDTWERDFDAGFVESYPNARLIVEIRNYADAHPEAKKMIIKINGTSYKLFLEPVDNWKTVTIGTGLSPGMLELYSEGPDREINDATMREAEMYVRDKMSGKLNKNKTVKNANARAKNAALMGLVAEHLNGNDKNGVLRAEINRLKKNGGARKTRKSRY